MKKFLLGTVGMVALGMAAPASAADLAARPYTKAPPPVTWLRSTIGPVSISAPMAAGARATTAWISLTRLAWPSLRAAAIGPEASSVASSVIAGNPASGCLAWKLRAIGRISATSASASSIHVLYSHQNQWHRPFHRPDRLRLERVTVLREGRRGGDRHPLQHP